MSTTAVTSPITEAYLAALREETGRRIGDAEIPDGWAPGAVPVAMFPYAVLYVGVTLMDGTYVNPHEDGLHRVQVTSIGRKRESAEALRDVVRAVLLDSTLEADGWVCVSTELANSQPIGRDDATDPATFYAVDVVNALWTPAPVGS